MALAIFGGISLAKPIAFVRPLPNHKLHPPRFVNLGCLKCRIEHPLTSGPIPQINNIDVNKHEVGEVYETEIKIEIKTETETETETKPEMTDQTKPKEEAIVGSGSADHEGVPDEVAAAAERPPLPPLPPLQLNKLNK